MSEKDWCDDTGKSRATYYRYRRKNNIKSQSLKSLTGITKEE